MTSTRSEPRRQRLNDLPLVQVERLAFIDFRLYFLGELRRADLIGRFRMAPAGATRDIALYREIAPENLAFDAGPKSYRPSVVFEPLFVHAPERVLTALSQGLGEIAEKTLEAMVPCEYPVALSVPSTAAIAPITRAIHRGKAVALEYVSLTSGRSRRELVPLALVDTGNRWHVRAFDRKSREFRDFVLTRMVDPVILESSPILPGETAAHDAQWNRVVDLDLVPHPGHPRPEAVRMDYNMPDGVLRVRVRAANVGYMLQKWIVDCSPDHSLTGKEYALWLKDPLVLYGANNALLAPGYLDPRATSRI